MRPRRILPWTVLLATACAAPPSPDETITEAGVRRVLTALSHDSMMGRRAFTPHVERAAAYLAAEFETMGLAPLDDHGSYLQPFAVFTLTPTTLQVMVDGWRVADDRVAAALSARAIAWETGDATRLKVIGPADDWREALGAIRREGGNTLVLMHPDHRAIFERLRGGRVRTIDLDGGPNTIYVLTEATGLRSYRVEARATVEEQRLANVVGVVPGRRADEIVLFSAHYDHIGVRPPVNGDSIGNGANDNASGVTAVVELARHFAAGPRPERTLVFAAFTAEEAGGYGSRYFSQQLDPDRIVAMFNIEMIGKPGRDGPGAAWITGYERSSFGPILHEAAASMDFTFGPDPYPAENLFYRSDNATLARLGVPAHTISTTAIDVDPDYHQVSDEARTLDVAHMTTTIRAIARAARVIVSGNATPTRVDPETVN